jgi:hypothetical protein
MMYDLYRHWQTKQLVEAACSASRTGHSRSSISCNSRAHPQARALGQTLTMVPFTNLDLI